MPLATNEQQMQIQARIEDYRSRRAKIMVAIKEYLKLITKANGYSHSIQNVTFDVRSWDTVIESETPIIFVVDDKTTDIVRHVGKTREYTWMIKLFGIVKNKTLVEFEEVLSDIEECLENNFNLGGVVSKVEIDQIVTDNQMFSEKEDTHLFDMELSVEYIRCHGNPR